MKKLLIGTAVVALGFGLAAPASAQVKLDLAGHFKGYGAWLDQDTSRDDVATAAIEAEDERSVSIVRETEIHFTGETTLDNGLTVGFHAEADIDGNGDTFAQEEAYAYFSGAWGRVNFGREDGAAYLLQVAAPSADSNIDGIRQYVQPVNFGIMTNTGAFAPAGDLDNITLDDLLAGGLGTAAALNTVVRDANGNTTAGVNDIRVGANIASLPALNTVFDYDHAVTGTSDKFTYLTPVFNGFQAGFSYTPEITGSRGVAGNNDDDSEGEYGDVWELSARYEGQFGELGLAVGAGYSHASLESDDRTPAALAANRVIFYQDVDNSGGFNAGDGIVASLDDRETWNVGIDLNWGPFGLGAVYTEDDNGISGDAMETDTWAVGIDYTTGPFKLGASYYERDMDDVLDVETDRWTGGVTYTYGPGMTFRGSISYLEIDESVGFVSDSSEATSVLLGTQIDF
jgi:predicted porin